ncbi:hypothetical protein J4Q44_G00301110 [Coregonus suidteri]|uniref:Uncharacterized protein n=1 Tax=Coregonus suidteri TaxID=861788 RepID=A0AAN8QJU5_9TELE
MSDSETAAPDEAPVPAACASIKADLDKCVKEGGGARLTGNVHCTESSMFPSIPFCTTSTGLNDTGGVRRLAETIHLLPSSPTPH